MSDRSDSLIPKHGGYRKLRSFQVARLVYDATRIFCRRFIAADRRTQDQMVQAARSGVQNIAEGSAASGTSKKTELSDIHTASPEVAANTLLCLIHQASYLLNRQIQRLERDFVQHGGFTERLHAVRHRARQVPGGPDAPPSLACPQWASPWSNAWPAGGHTRVRPSGAVPPILTAGARAPWKKPDGPAS